MYIVKCNISTQSYIMVLLLEVVLFVIEMSLGGLWMVVDKYISSRVSTGLGWLQWICTMPTLKWSLQNTDKLCVLFSKYYLWSLLVLSMILKCISVSHFFYGLGSRPQCVYQCKVKTHQSLGIKGGLSGLHAILTSYRTSACVGLSFFHFAWKLHRCS